MIYPDEEEVGELATVSFVHYAMIVLFIAVFGYEMWLPADAFAPILNSWGFVSGNYFSAFEYKSPVDQLISLGTVLADFKNLAALKAITSIFLHLNFFHLMCNVFFIWIFGDNVEFSLGHIRYIIFILFSMWFSAFGHVLLFGPSAVPQIGADGIAFALAGAYAFYYPRARITYFYMPEFITRGPRDMPVRYFIGLLFVLAVAQAPFTSGLGVYSGFIIGMRVMEFAVGYGLARILKRSSVIFQDDLQKALKSDSDAIRKGKRRRH